MNHIEIIDVKERVEALNEQNAADVRAYIKRKKVYLVNVMSSPGAGKTTTLVRTINGLKEKWRIAVMEADVDSSVDARTIQVLTGAKVIQLHTGGSCHMDAGMTMEGLMTMGIDDVDVVFLENVGNLVCPAEFDVGADLRVEILSVPEGDDKPLKYPLMFQVCQCILVNKIDTRKYFPFDDAAFEQRIHDLNPDAKIIFLSAKTLEGFEEWISWLRQQIVASGKKVGGQE